MFDDFRLRVFKAVASEGSFTKAAKKLGVSQPAISQNVAAIEESLGVQLFERLKGEVRITPEGQIFESYADRILFWYDTVPAVFESRRNSARKTVTIVIDGGVPRNIVQGLSSFIADVNPLLAVTFCGPSSALAPEADMHLKSSFAKNAGSSAAGVVTVEVSETFVSDPLSGIIRRFLEEILY